MVWGYTGNNRLRGFLVAKFFTTISRIMEFLDP